MKIIYIASPYSIGDIAANVARQMEVAHLIMDAGHCPIVPLMSHYLHIYRRRPYQEWLNCDLALIPKVDLVVRLPGESKGADQEVALAESLNIPVVFGLVELLNDLNDSPL